MVALDESDRATLARARRLAGAVTHEGRAAFFASEPLGMVNPLAKHVGNGDDLRALTLVLAQSLLAEVVDIAERPADRTPLLMLRERVTALRAILWAAEGNPLAEVVEVELARWHALIVAALRSDEPR